MAAGGEGEQGGEDVGGEGAVAVRWVEKRESDAATRFLRVRTAWYWDPRAGRAKRSGWRPQGQMQRWLLAIREVGAEASSSSALQTLAAEKMAMALLAPEAGREMQVDGGAEKGGLWVVDRMPDRSNLRVECSMMLVGSTLNLGHRL